MSEDFSIKTLSESILLLRRRNDGKFITITIRDWESAWGVLNVEMAKKLRDALNDFLKKAEES